MQLERSGFARTKVNRSGEINSSLRDTSSHDVFHACVFDESSNR